MKKSTLISVCALFGLLAGCSEAPKPAAKSETKPAEPVSGRYALFQMYTAARAWAPDIETLKLTSIPMHGVKPQPGKNGAWQAIFVSARSNRARSYTYSVVEGEGNLHKGVFAGPEEGWSGPRGITKPFPMAAVKVDSDAAHETAMKKGAEYAKKNPDKPIMYLMERTNKYPDPAWRIVWGESIGTSNYSIYVDAGTGLYLETVH